jgi:predicted alpha/beta superfamily hydrolase
MTQRVSAAIAIALLASACGAPLAPSSPELHSRTGTATVVVHYDAGWGHAITLRGDGPLDWGTGTSLENVAGNEWEYQVELSSAMQFKPLYDDQTWAIGPNWTVAPGQTLDVWPFFFNTTGNVSYFGDWNSPTLGNTRGVWVYLPPSYSENQSERYPVVYMHDGQNLFDDSMSATGVSWNVGGAMDDGANDGSIHEAIIIGIENSSNRTWEYTPNYDQSTGDGGGADTYLNAVINELKPWVDSSLRTYGDAQHTIMIGSSLGGLMSAYTGITRPDVFGMVGVMSPSTWWDNNWVIGAVQATNGQPQPLRVYLDSGDAGPSNDDVTQTKQLAQAYRDNGDDLDYQVQHGGQHGEYWWRQRVPGALAFLLGPR